MSLYMSAFHSTTYNYKCKAYIHLQIQTIKGLHVLEDAIVDSNCSLEVFNTASTVLQSLAL